MSDDRRMTELINENENLRTLVVAVRRLIVYQNDECEDAARLLRRSRGTVTNPELGIEIDAHLRKYGRIE